MVYGKIAKRLPPLRRPKLSKKAQDKEDETLKNLLRLICGGIIGNSNYIGTIFNGLIQEEKPKEKNIFGFFKKKHR